MIEGDITPYISVVTANEPLDTASHLVTVAVHVV